MKEKELTLVFEETRNLASGWWALSRLDRSVDYASKKSEAFLRSGASRNLLAGIGKTAYGF